jgi:chromosome segregation ATPase
MEVNSAAGEILHCARQKLLAKNLPLELLPRNLEAKDWTTIREECNLTLSETLSLKNHMIPSLGMASSLQSTLVESTTLEHALNYSITERANQLAKYNDLTEQHEQAETQMSKLIRGSEEAGDEFNNIKRHNLELSEDNTILQKALASSVSLSEQTVNNLKTMINTHHAKHTNTVSLEKRLQHCREHIQNYVNIEGQNIKLNDNIKKLKSTLRLKEKDIIQVKTDLQNLKNEIIDIGLARNKVIEELKKIGGMS